MGGSAGGVEGGDSGDCTGASERESRPLTAVNIMRANIHAHHAVALDTKNHPKIAFNDCRVNRVAVLRRKPVDFVGPQARIERVLLEYFPSAVNGLPLLGWKGFQFLPKALGRSIAILHFVGRGGGSAPLITRSMSKTRPVFRSSMLFLKSSGTHEWSVSTTNLVTSTRSSGERALICSMISAALILEVKPKMAMTASAQPVPREPPRWRKGQVGVGGRASMGLRGGVSPSPLPERGAPFHNGKRREAK